MLYLAYPEEQQMQETLRRLRKTGGKGVEILPMVEKDNCPLLLPTPKKVESDEIKSSKIKETPFPGEFSLMRIPG